MKVRVLVTLSIILMIVIIVGIFHCRIWEGTRMYLKTTVFDIELERGSIWVLFDPEISYEQKQEIVKKSGLITEHHNITDVFSKKFYAELEFWEIIVPSGEEIKWVCYFKKQKGVEDATLSYLEVQAI